MNDNSLQDWMRIAGFEPYHTGGGCMAWLREEPKAETHTLITFEEVGLGTWEDREKPDWLVGRYRNEDNCDALYFGNLTLARAIAISRRMPVPKVDEDRFLTEADLVPLWVCEFGEAYRPDPEILELLNDPRVTDASYHNDVAPHFEADAGDGQIVELWFYRADPNDRADEGDSIPADQPRYSLCLADYEGGSRQVAVEELATEDPGLIVQTFKGLMKE